MQVIGLSIPVWVLQWLIIGIAYGVLCFQPSSRIVQAVLQAQINSLKETPEKKKELFVSLVLPGKATGILERLIILTLALLAQWTAIAFVMTAKGFVIGSFSRDETQKGLTEYYLIGTFCSFAIAIIGGEVARRLVHLVN